MINKNSSESFHINKDESEPKHGSKKDDSLYSIHPQQGKGSSVKFTNVSDRDDVEIDMIGYFFPLRLGLQLLGFWHPGRIPKIISWCHYLIFFALSLWFAIWTVYYVASQSSDKVSSSIRGFVIVLLQLLWILVPFVINKKNREFVNGLQFIVDNSKIIEVSWIHTLGFSILLIPQLCYIVLSIRPFYDQHIIPTLPWPHNYTSDLINQILIITGLILNFLCIDITIITLGIAAHSQSYQINNFMENNIAPIRDPIRSNSLKTTLHLTMKSLRYGNEQLEFLYFPLLLALLIYGIQLFSDILCDSSLNMDDLIRLALLLLLLYQVLIPPAYTSHCWHKVYEVCLEMHALSLTSNHEMGPTIIYMNNISVGFRVCGLRMDFLKLYLLTFLLVGLLSTKAIIVQQLNPNST